MITQPHSPLRPSPHQHSHTCRCTHTSMHSSQTLRTFSLFSPGSDSQEVPWPLKPDIVAREVVADTPELIQVSHLRIVFVFTRFGTKQMMVSIDQGVISKWVDSFSVDLVSISLLFAQSQPYSFLK